MRFPRSARFLVRSVLRDNALSERRVRRLIENETMPAEALRRANDARLRRTLRAAARRLPAYACLDGVAVAADVRAALQETLPVMTKDDLLEARGRFYPNGGRRRPWTIVGRTSGTTGTPLEVFRSRDSVLWEHAFIRRHMLWSGYRAGMPRASLRGDVVAPVTQTRPPFWFHVRYDNRLHVSSRHLRDAHADAIIDALDRFTPFLMEAYPSTAYDLALFLQQRGRFLAIPCVFTGSEPLYDHQRSLIRERFNAKIFDFYGMAERVAFAAECEEGSLHVNTDYSFVEIVDDDGQPTDGEGFIVGTTFHNLTMPLVRYRMSDRTRWKPGACRCGRAYPMIEKVSGKFEDTVHDTTGQRVSPSIVTFAFKGVERIRSSQVAQLAPGRWEVRLVPFEGFSAADEARLVANLKMHVDPDLNVRVVCMPEIPRTKSAKYRWIVNEHQA